MAIAKSQQVIRNFLPSFFDMFFAIGGWGVLEHDYFNAPL
jgi:hypothetical protein